MEKVIEGYLPDVSLNYLKFNNDEFNLGNFRVYKSEEAYNNDFWEGKPKKVKITIEEL